MVVTRRVELVYDFDDYYGKGRDTIKINVKDFKYYVDVSEEEEKLSYLELKEKYKQDAFKSAAAMAIDDLAAYISSTYKSTYSA